MEERERERERDRQRDKETERERVEQCACATTHKSRSRSRSERKSRDEQTMRWQAIRRAMGALDGVDGVWGAAPPVSRRFDACVGNIAAERNILPLLSTS
jgi:hypothetical protein